MRQLLVTALFAASALLSAQQPAPSASSEGSNWQHVRALPAGASIHVKAQHSSAICKLKSVDADSLTCTGVKDITFQRAEIRSITIPRRGLSTAIGAAAGAGAGVAVGAGLGPTVWTSRGKGAGVGVAIFAPIGAIIGAATDFAHSTVYKAP